MKPLIDRIPRGTATVLDCYQASFHNESPPREEEVWEIHITDHGITPAYATSADDAEFIAEAFTVAHETGMTPRQMAERCKLVDHLSDHMVEALTAAFKKADDAGQCALVTTLTGDPDALHVGPGDRRFVIPEGMPPLPPGTRYAGQLKDHDGDVRGYAFDFRTPEHGWVHCGALPYAGRADWPESGSAQWHVATPIAP